jgi:hypothetical protein
MLTGYKRPNFGVLRDGISWVAGQFERYEDFDLSAVERALGELPPEQDFDADAEEFGHLLQWVWATPGDLSVARKRFAALAREAVTDPGESRAAVAFSRLVAWCSPSRGAHVGETTAFHQFCAASATLDPRLVDGKTYADLAVELGISKAATSAAARNFRDEFSFHFHEYRGAAGREHMRQARLAQRAVGAERAMNRNFGKR